MRKRIVTIGGGSGHSQFLAGLAAVGAAEEYNITAVVSTADDGGPNGVIAKEYNIAPPSDIRKCLIALANNQKLAEFWSHRFTGGPLNDYTVGNLLLTAYAQRDGDMTKACSTAEKELATRGNVLPITNDPAVLVAVLEDGTEIVGETAVDMRGASSVSVDHVKLQQQRTITAAAREAIESADYIVFTMGDVFTSIIPNLLIDGCVDAIASSNAKTIAICNRTNKAGETDGFTAADIIAQLQRYLGTVPLNYAIMDSLQQPVPEAAEAVQPASVDGVQCIQDDIADEENLLQVSGAKAAQVMVDQCV